MSVIFAMYIRQGVQLSSREDGAGSDFVPGPSTLVGRGNEVTVKSKRPASDSLVDGPYSQLGCLEHHSLVPESEDSLKIHPLATRLNNRRAPVTVSHALLVRSVDLQLRSWSTRWKLCFRCFMLTVK